MPTRQTIETYFQALRARDNPEALFADDVVFTSLVSPNKTVSGKPAVAQVIGRFYSMVTDWTLKDLVVEDDRAVALTQYTLQPPNGASFVTDVAEAFVVRAGKIADFKICFDTAPYPK